MRRPFHRRLFRASRPDIPPALGYAIELFANGDFPAEAQSFEQLEHVAEAVIFRSRIIVCNFYA